MGFSEVQRGFVTDVAMRNGNENVHIAKATAAPTVNSLLGRNCFGGSRGAMCLRGLLLSSALFFMHVAQSQRGRFLTSRLEATDYSSSLIAT